MWTSTVLTPPGRVSTFRGQPRWTLPALGLILLVAAVLYSYNIGYSGLSTYYASAAKSMSESWSALATGAMNPSATMTLDKLSGFVVPQALAIRLFGFHAWALSLPQVFEGLITIVASYSIGTRWRGPVVGIATAAEMAVTPMLAAMFGRPMEDGLLTMTMVLAFAAWQRSLLSGRASWLVIAGFWVAVGFQAKMMQSWLIVPALLVGTLVACRGPVRRRLAQAAVLGAVAGLLSISWMTAIQITPASDRAYIDGTTNNNTFSMVFGYNGFDRLVPGLIPGAVAQLGAGSGQTATNGTRTADAGHSLLKIVLPEITSQIGWLYPAAIGGAIFEAIAIIRRRKRDHAADQDSRADLGMIVALFGWLGITGAVLSAAFVPHATYFGVLALPLAVLAVVGIADAIRWYRRGEPGLRGLALPILTAAQTAWQLVIVLNGATSLRWLGSIIGGLGLMAVVLLIWGRLTGPPTRSAIPTRSAATTAIVAAIAACMLPPVIWSSFVLGPGGGGSGSDAYAGPRMEAAGVGSPGKSAIEPSATTRSTPLLRAPFSVPPDPRLNAEQERLVQYVVAHNGGRRTLFATDTLAVAVSIILFSRYDAEPMGGFSRLAPTTTASTLSTEISRHRLRYVLLADTTPNTANTAIVGVRLWTTRRCAPVLHGLFRDGSTIPLTLFDCRAAARAVWSLRQPEAQGDTRDRPDDRTPACCLSRTAAVGFPGTVDRAPGGSRAVRVATRLQRDHDVLRKFCQKHGGELARLRLRFA